MRAARFRGPDQPVRIEEVPYPVAGAGEVVVRVAACGICGSDLHFLEGLPVPGPLPITLGHEPAGVVESVGEGVRQWSPGQRVALHVGRGCGSCRPCRSGHPSCCPSIRVPGLHIDGAFAEALPVPHDCLIEVPDSVSLAAAAVATDCVASPYHALVCRGGFQAGERVAVIGAGGLGGQGIRLALALGAEQVMAVDLSPAALERATAAGASQAIRAEPGSDPAAEIVRLTDGGADLVLECVGVPDAVATGARALRPGGRLVLVGVGMEPPRIDLPQAMFAVSEISVLGSFGSHPEDLEQVLKMQADGTLDIESSISHRIGLDRLPEGLEMLRTKTGNPDRIVVEL
jgi:threonine dehydrogenase-like Zn-dependent dehydrogenase